MFVTKALLVRHGSIIFFLTFNFDIFSQEEKYLFGSFLYIILLGSNSFAINCQTAFREEYLNYFTDGFWRPLFCSLAYEMFLQERLSRTLNISRMRDSFALKDILP